MVGSLAHDPGGLSSLGGRGKHSVVSDGEKEEERRRRRTAEEEGVFIPDAVAPHKEGKSKSVSM